MCGENAADAAGESVSGGSPPRVRGKLNVYGAIRANRGITPACAGKTYSSCRRGCRCEDHPRVCGENAVLFSSLCPHTGSPPRVRGKLHKPVPNFLGKRITPACAGKTLIDSSHNRAIRDHPRVCGENHPCPCRLTSCRGSPPRVRGKPIVLYGASSLRRITPACAGKTLSCSLFGSFI